MAGTKRKARVTRRSTERCQSRTKYARTRSVSSASANEQANTSNDRKRKNVSEETSSSKKSNKENSIPNFRRKIGENGQKYDAFCWVCHKAAEEYYCPDCFRVYHDSCRNKIKKYSKSCTCECKLTSVEGLQTSSCTDLVLRDLLLHALHNVTEENKSQKKNEDKNPGYMRMFATWPDMQENDILYDTIDIEFIIDNINLKNYKSTGDFYQAVKLLYHNCYIVYGSDNEITLKAQKFEKAIKQQLTDIEACPDCYREKYAKYPEIDFFAKVCSRQHQIVWAKLKGFPFWPAKCLRIVNGHADVRFFGTHDKSLVPLAQVYKISKRNPGSNPKKPKCSTRMSTYDESMAELSLYVINYENKFGSFVYSKEKTPLEVENNTLGKEKQQAKSSSQPANDDSMNADINDSTEFSATQNSPQLNVSCLNEVETKVNLPILCLERYCGKNNEDLAENVVLMTFSTTEEDTPAETIPTTSESQSQLLEMSSQTPETVSDNNSSDVCDSNVPSANVCPENVLHKAECHINKKIMDTDSTLPVLITSTHSLNQSFNQPTNLANEAPRTSGNEGEFSGNSANDDDDDDDDEVQLLTESSGDKNGKSIGDYLIKNKCLTKSLCELLLSNKPKIRNAVAQYQNISLQFFLMMWLEANKSRFDVTETENFYSLYEKMSTKLNLANTQLRCQQKEIAELKEKLAIKITDEERKAALQREISQIFAKGRINSENKAVLELKKRGLELEQTKKQLSDFEEMHKNHVEKLNRRINELKQTVKELNERIEINSQKDTKSVACLTSCGMDIPMDINTSPTMNPPYTHSTVLSRETTQSSSKRAVEVEATIIEHTTTTCMMWK